MRHIQTFPVESGVIHQADLFEDLRHAGYGDIGVFQIFQHIIRTEQRTECGDPSESDLIDLGEHILKLVIDLCHSIVLQGSQLSISNVAAHFLLMDIVRIILIEFVPAGRFLPAEDRHQPVIKSVDSGSTVVGHGFRQTIQDHCIFQTSQFLVHIAEI